MAFRGLYIPNSQVAPFNVDGPAAEVVVMRDAAGDVQVIVYDRVVRYGDEGPSREVQRTTLSQPGASVRIIIQEYE